MEDVKVFFAVVLCLALGWGAESAAEREKRLQEKLIAVCCWNESIAVHRSGTAAEMRAELHAMLADGKSDVEILNAFTAKYSKRVLAVPEGPESVVMYALPAAAGVLGLLIAWRVLRRWLQRPAEA